MLEVDGADHGDIGGLSTREVEVCHGRATAHWCGGDVIGVRRESAGNVEDIADVDGFPHQHVSGIDRPETD